MHQKLIILTSCDTDQKIANYLITGNWKGNLDTYYTNRWGDAFLDGEYYTVWRFEPGGYDDWGYVTSGYGTEADYNVYDDREFAYSSFRWEVRNGNIYIYYDDPTWNNVRIDWRDYSISSSRFRGTMYDWEERIYNFDLANVGFLLRHLRKCQTSKKQIETVIPAKQRGLFFIRYLLHPGIQHLQPSTAGSWSLAAHYASTRCYHQWWSDDQS